MEKEDKVQKVLKKAIHGLSITEISKKSKLSRSSVIAALAKLEGAKKISFRKIGMAKIYSLNRRRK